MGAEKPLFLQDIKGHWPLSRKRKLVVRRVLARELGCDVRTVARWEDEGLPVARLGRGGRPSLFDVALCRRWKRTRDEALRERNGHLNPLQARALKDHWQGLLAQQKHEIVQRTLIPADEMEREMIAEVLAAKRHLLLWSNSLVTPLMRAAAMGADELARVLDQAVKEVLRELATGKHRPLAIPEMNGRGELADKPEPRPRRRRQRKKGRTRK